MLPPNATGEFVVNEKATVKCDTGYHLSTTAQFEPQTGEEKAAEAAAFMAFVDPEEGDGADDNATNAVNDTDTAGDSLSNSSSSSVATEAEVEPTEASLTITCLPDDETKDRGIWSPPAPTCERTCVLLHRMAIVLRRGRL